MKPKTKPVMVRALPEEFQPKALKSMRRRGALAPEAEADRIAESQTHPDHFHCGHPVSAGVEVPQGLTRDGQEREPITYCGACAEDA